MGSQKWGPKNGIPKMGSQKWGPINRPELKKTLKLFFSHNEREDYGGFRSWMIESATGKSFRYNSRNNYNDNGYDRHNNNNNYRRDDDFSNSRNFGRNDRNYDRNNNGRGRSYDDYRNNDYDKVRELVAFF